MKKQLVSTMVSGAMLAAGAVSAAEPVALDNAQLDKVTAAGSAFASAGAWASGVIISAVSTFTSASVISLPAIPTQGGQLLPTVSYAFAAASAVSQ